APRIKTTRQGSHEETSHESTQHVQVCDAPGGASADQCRSPGPQLRRAASAARLYGEHRKRSPGEQPVMMQRAAVEVSLSRRATVLRTAARRAELPLVGAARH